MSIGVEYSVDPSSTSGGRYHRVTTSFEYVFVGTDFARAKPKSASCSSNITRINSILQENWARIITLSSPFSLISKFCGLRSRCRMRRRWQYAKPRSSWNRKIYYKLRFSTPPLKTDAAIPLWPLRCSCSIYCRNRPCTASGPSRGTRTRASGISPCGLCRGAWLLINAKTDG